MIHGMNVNEAIGYTRREVLRNAKNENETVVTMSR
jgi:hypothetical protein